MKNHPKGPITDRYPWIALLGWFPLVYVLGIVRYWGEPWTTWDGGFFPLSSPHPVFMWPTLKYRAAKAGNGWYTRKG